MAFRDYGTCTMCGKENAEITYVNDDDHVCDECLDSFFQKCDECEEYYSLDVDFVETADGRTVCEYCAVDLDEE